MSRHLRLTVRWPHPLKRGLAVTLSGVVISIVSLIGAPPERPTTSDHAVLQIELRVEHDTTKR
jgi:hypothetical protein